MGNCLRCSREEKTLETTVVGELASKEGESYTPPTTSDDSLSHIEVPIMTPMKDSYDTTMQIHSNATHHIGESEYEARAFEGRQDREPSQDGIIENKTGQEKQRSKSMGVNFSKENPEVEHQNRRRGSSPAVSIQIVGHPQRKFTTTNIRPPLQSLLDNGPQAINQNFGVRIVAKAINQNNLPLVNI